MENTPPPQPPPQETTTFPANTPGVTSPKHDVDDLFKLFDEMKTRLLSVEFLWIRLKQLEHRQDSNEQYLNRLNGRISNWQRRDQDSEGEVTQREYEGDDVSRAEEFIRQHSAQKPFPQQHQQPTTT